MSQKKVVYPLDEHYTEKGEVYAEGNVGYCCTLNQTEIDANKNKFYIMQVINTGSDYKLFIRYGRIGEIGKPSTKSLPNADSAVADFKKQFKAKTGNAWGTDGFIKKEGKYFLTDVKYEVDEPDIVVNSTQETTKLDERIQYLMKLFSNKDTMNNMLIKLDIDTKKLPLGKISKKQLDLAQETLNKIKKVFENYKVSKKNNSSDDSNSDNSSDDSDKEKKIKFSDLDCDKTTKLSSEFYTLIPYSCGRRKPPLIDNKEILGKYMELIEEMTNLEIAVKVTKNMDGKSGIDGVYNGLDTDIMPLQKNNEMWNVISTYIKNTHAPTHHYKVELVDIYEINRKNEPPIVQETLKKIGNVHLLWHGSRMTNFCSILKNGLLLNPETLGVYITGKMFSSGIYTADAFSKSMNYCAPEISDNIGVLLLCEVALGTPAKRTNADYYISKKSLEKEGCHSTWGMGTSAPCSKITLKNKVVVPNGKLQNTSLKSSLLYDEFVIYDSNQISLRYLVVVKKI